MKSINNYFNKKVALLLQDLAFYIPKELIPPTVIEELKGKIAGNIYNQLFILDLQNGLGEFEVKIFNERLLKKKSQLQETLFELTQQQQTTPKKTFNYLLLKYTEQVEFYKALSKWFSHHLKKYPLDKKINIQIIGSFGLQQEFYEQHFKQLLNTFYKKNNYQIRKGYTQKELILEYIPELIQHYVLAAAKNSPKTVRKQSKQTEESSQKEKSSQKTVQKQSTKLKRTKKQPPISETEAELFLLENVFNVPQELLNTVFKI